LVAGDIETFQLDLRSGALSLQQPVDREQRELYRLTIRLSDSVHTTDISQILLVSNLVNYFQDIASATQDDATI
jgi:Cadherin domain